MKNIKAVVFDMDGLMFDTERLWMESLLQAAEEKGWKLDREFLVSIAGLRKDIYDEEIRKNLGDDFDISSCRQRADIIFNGAIENGQLGIKKGLKQLLEFFKEKKLTLAIASSSDVEDVKYRLRVCGVDESYFTSIIGGDMVKKAKPDPYIYSKSCQVLGVDPQNAMALEDSEVGVEAAAKAGLVTIHIPDMKPSNDKTKKLAYQTLSNLAEVIDLFK